MKIHDSNTFEFTQHEEEVRSLFEDLRGEGFSVPEAAEHALSVLPKPDPQFVKHLSDGALSVVDGRVVTHNEGRDHGRRTGLNPWRK